jgi:hypothetical protein
VVRPRQIAVQRKVLFDHRSAKCHSSDGDLDARSVIRVAYGNPEGFPDRQHGAQIHLGHGRWVLRRAVKHGDPIPRRPTLLEHAQGGLDLAQGAHAGGENDRLAVMTHVAQVWQVGDLAGGNLEGIRAQFDQQIDALAVESR